MEVTLRRAFLTVSHDVMGGKTTWVRGHKITEKEHHKAVVVDHKIPEKEHHEGVVVGSAHSR